MQVLLELRPLLSSACQQLLLVLQLGVFASSGHHGRFAARDDCFEVVLAQVHVTMVDSDAGMVHERLQVQSRCAQAEEVVMSCG